MEIKTREIEITVAVRIKTVKWVVAWDWQRRGRRPADNEDSISDGA